VTTGNYRLESNWPFLRDQLPAESGRVVEIGCGSEGGFVPKLRRSGHEAVGVDPEAPQAPGYFRTEFEKFDVRQPVDVIVACVSLHHVADLDHVLCRAGSALGREGVLVVVEWAWERFDDSTARWCFDRLPPSTEADHNWLRETRDRWIASGQGWDTYLRDWATREGLHPGAELLRRLDTRFDRRSLTRGPYFFPDLQDTSEADECAAIDSGAVQASALRYVGQPKAAQIV
jgi:SAM-dependent methyltransferase